MNDDIVTVRLSGQHSVSLCILTTAMTIDQGRPVTNRSEVMKTALTIARHLNDEGKLGEMLASLRSR